MDVELREITAETVRDVCELEVAADQHSFVAPNSVSIAEAHYLACRPPWSSWQSERRRETTALQRPRARRRARVRFA